MRKHSKTVVRRSTAAAVAAVVCFVVAIGGAAAAEKPPNIVVIYTDDHGYADLSCQDIVNDIRTPNVDALAASGVRMRHGYSTAPQCVPSRGGLMTGRFQSRFGLESNASSLDGFNQQTTIAQRLREAGYVTAQFGKWHLGPPPQIIHHGFRYAFAQNAQRPFAANVNLDGTDRPMSMLEPTLYHIDACSRTAASVIKRHHESPLFLYVAYRAPHVPLDAPGRYLQRFPGEMPERRRQALAMLSAVDDGVGLIRRTLDEFELTERTLIFYIGDNGAPLKIHKADAPGGGPGWDGKKNDPLNGEKGMLAEGGMHVPFVVSWPGKIPANQTYDHPVTALDVAATACGIADIAVDADELDGVNLVPYLTGELDGPPHERLCWRWISQSAIRKGKWKLLRGGTREYLYDLDADIEEQHNLVDRYPQVADQLRSELARWAEDMEPPGLATAPMSATWEEYFDFYLEGKPPTSRPEAASTQSPVGDWVIRNGRFSIENQRLVAHPNRRSDTKATFLAHHGVNVKGPVAVTLQLRSDIAGTATIAWRTPNDKRFQADAAKRFSIDSGDGFETYRVELPVPDRVIHLRLLFPPGAQVELQTVQVEGAGGQSDTLWPLESKEGS